MTQVPSHGFGTHQAAGAARMDPEGVQNRQADADGLGKMKTVIALPAYHAEQTLERTISAIPDGVADELILVDDASRDGTADVARRLGLQVHVHPLNRGYGGNQKTCYTMALASDADLIVLLHPDYQYEPKAVPLLIAPILAGDADMTFGSRFAGMGDPLGGGMPLYRYMGNRLTTVAQNVLLGTRFTDMHSGMRAYTRKCLLSMPFLRYSEGFDFDAEFLVDAVTSGQRVVEVPIPTRYSKESSSISIERSLNYVAKGTTYAARRGLSRGHRGKRYIAGWERSRPASVGEAGREGCMACGESGMRLRYPASTASAATHHDFTCTTSNLGDHDDIFECRRCGLMSSRPSLNADEVLDQYRASEDPDYFDEEDARRRSFLWVLEQIAAFPVGGRRLLEIGSHAGMFLRAAEQRGWAATGIEPSAWAVAAGRTRYGVDLREGTLESLHFESADVDACVMLDVLEHLVDPLAALRHLRTGLGDQGLLAFTTVNAQSPFARLVGRRWPALSRAHLHYFTPTAIATLLRRSGFRMVHWTPVAKQFRLSYVLDRAGETLPASKQLRSIAAHVNPTVPLGLMGDLVLVLARPTRE
jgi:glycosyltransferase involved in cell wall biosynthesis/SAM-dependent methyltransferase